MVSKDQTIGGVIFIVCVIVAVLYLAAFFYPPWTEPLVGKHDNLRLWLVAIPVIVAFVAVLGIGAWIGWTMATTPPPKPIEEITSELEEKKEEEKPAEQMPEEPSPPPPSEPEEEKKPERRRKT